MRTLIEAVFDRAESVLPPCVTPEEAAGPDRRRDRTAADAYVHGVAECAAATLQGLRGGYLADWYAAVAGPLGEFIAARRADPGTAARPFVDAAVKALGPLPHAWSRP